MDEGQEDVSYLRGLSARLRSLALIEPHIADQLMQIAEEAERRASAIVAKKR